MYLLIDFINPQGTRGFTTRLDKISKNVDAIAPLKESIEQQKKTRKVAFSTLTVVGRWLIVYQANVANDNDTIMHFIDFRVDLKIHGDEQIFSETTMQNLMTLQSRYDTVYTDKMNTVELTFAEPFEIILKGNIISCDDDNMVIAKAKKLGVFPMTEALQKGDGVKATLIDEKQVVDDTIITNIYAIIYFGGYGEEKKDSGYAYLKIYDLSNNFDKIPAFFDAVEAACGKITRTMLMERFDKFKLN